MDDFKVWVARRVSEIEAEIASLSDGGGYERNADALGIDREFYATALEVVKDYEDESAFSRRFVGVL
jgi:hypothetical protein